MQQKNIKTQSQTQTQSENKYAKRILAFFLAAVMIFGCAPFLAINVFAEDADGEEEEEIDVAKVESERISRFAGAIYDSPENKLKTFGKTDVLVEGTGLNQKITVGEEKLSIDEVDLTPIFSKNGFELYYQYETGEVAIRETATGQILFSNPWDIGKQESARSAATREELMSQIIIDYKESGDRNSTFNSFNQAARNRQIKMKRIKGGIRVEYTIGREQKRRLVPRMIERSSFENNIMALIAVNGTQREYEKVEAYYLLKDVKKPGLSKRAINELIATYPATERYALYVFDPTSSERELREIEDIIKRCTKYSFEKMDEDHALLNYIPPLSSPPLFKLALEYYIDEEGLYVRLPVNGLRFDESTYDIKTIKVLPYMGAGRRGNTGYTFIPDGSGTLVRYEDIGSNSFVQTNRVYGPDFAYYTVTGGEHARKWRLPVYGAVENFRVIKGIYTEPLNIYYDGEGNRLEDIADIPMRTVDDEGNELAEPEPIYYDEKNNVLDTPKVIHVDREGNEYDEEPEKEFERRSDGYLAIIEEGEMMAEISTRHGGTTDVYNTAYSQFSPRPMDDFWLDAAMTGLSGMITSKAKRKYTGNYIIRYIMLSSDTSAGGPKKAGGYEATYVGMAKAYRDYLINRGQLTQKINDGSDIPLFIETLGTIKTAEYFFGMPYEGTTPLTTFEDITTMIDELNGDNIKNIKFRLNGWMNGGLISTLPTKVSVENAMGGRKGLADAIKYAKEKGSTIFPDMDFALVFYFRPFDGSDDKLDPVQYMNERWARTQSYSYIFQEITAWRYDMLLAHERMDQLYTKAMKDYNKIDENIGSLGVVSLARELHSNHNRKSLINRAEAKDYVISLFERMKEDHGSLMAVEANSYSFKYLDSILKADLDSSRTINQSEAIPFYGMITHGFIDIAGDPINMSGDMRYDVLKIIENGANPYFILSTRNANRLKEAEWWQLTAYYSVDYNVWKSDVLSIYHELNDALKDVKSKPIVNHEFIDKNVVRVTYEGGTSFILNYNNFDEVTVDGKVVAPLNFIKIS